MSTCLVPLRSNETPAAFHAIRHSNGAVHFNLRV